MKKEDQERLIRIVTAEVLKALTGESPGETKGDCSSVRSNGGIQSECCQEQNESDRRFEGGVLAVADVERFAALNSVRVLLGPGTIVTPLARDVAGEKGITLARSPELGGTRQCATRQPGKTVVIVFGRESRSHRQAMISAAEAKGYAVRVDAPSGDRTDAILKAAIRCTEMVREEKSSRLVVLDENVYPMAFRLGKIDGVRPAVCWDAQTASQSSKVAEANVLVLNNRLLGVPMLRRITEAWLEG